MAVRFVYQNSLIACFSIFRNEVDAMKIDQHGTCIINPKNEVIRTSRNLRAMRDYARVSPVRSVRLEKDGACRGLLWVSYVDGCRSGASFASYHIMVDWVRARRSWRGAIITMPENMGYLTKPGIIAGV